MSVALIHPSMRIVPLLTQVAQEVMADFDLMHLVDEGLLRLVTESGGMTEPVIRRLCSYARNAQEAGAEAVVLTSPAIGAAIDAVRAAVRIPAMRIDEAMADTAVRYGESIGVVAASQVTLDPTLALLRERADARKKDVEFVGVLCAAAGHALAAGDLDAYDRATVDCAERMATHDVIVLADVLMHRAVTRMGERVRVPVLSSPTLGFEALAKKLNLFRR